MSEKIIVILKDRRDFGNKTLAVPEKIISFFLLEIIIPASVGSLCAQLCLHSKLYAKRIHFIHLKKYILHNSYIIM